VARGRRIRTHDSFSYHVRQRLLLTPAGLAGGTTAALQAASSPSLDSRAATPAPLAHLASAARSPPERAFTRARHPLCCSRSLWPPTSRPHARTLKHAHTHASMDAPTHQPQLLVRVCAPLTTPSPSTGRASWASRRRGRRGRCRRSRRRSRPSSRRAWPRRRRGRSRR